MGFFDFLMFLVLLVVAVVVWKSYSKKIKSSSLGILAQELDTSISISAANLAAWNADSMETIDVNKIKKSREKLDKLKELYSNE